MLHVLRKYVACYLNDICAKLVQHALVLNMAGASFCRKMDSAPVDEVLRATIRNICTQLVGAINKYYAFGSAFVDEAT